MINNSCGIYSIPKESKYTAVYLSVNNETQCVPSFLLLLIFLTCTPSFIHDKLFLNKIPLNLGS